MPKGLGQRLKMEDAAPTSRRLNVVVRSPPLYPRRGPKWRDNYPDGPDHSVAPTHQLVIDGIIFYRISIRLLFHYRFPTLRLELSINRWRYSLLFFYPISICLYFFTVDFQPLE